jgi:hypothetical protein
MRGAAVATHDMGAPRLAAAISGAGTRATTAIVNAPGGAVNAPAGASAALAAAGTGSGRDRPRDDAGDAARDQAFNMQLLSLQDQVQQDSQRFSTLSNVMRAKHDTAKAAVSNIRS